MTLPIVHLTGTPAQQGVQHGRELKARIAHNLAVYFDRFAREVKLPRHEVLERAQAYLPIIAQHNAAYLASMEGVAQGSGFDLLELVALNMRYEILYYQFGVQALLQAPAIDGCTAFAIMPQAATNGHLWLGQNWDWIPQVQGAVLHTTEADGLQTLAYTEAGIVGAKIGFNSAGLGLTINGLTTTDDDWMRPSKPFHVRCYEILRSRDFAAATRIVTDEARACSTNFLIAQPPGNIANIEAAPDKIHLLPCEDGCVVHTNHFVDPQGLGVVEPPNERRPHSYHRRTRLTALLTSKPTTDLADLQSYLRDDEDHPFGICRAIDYEVGPEEWYTTVTSVIMDLDAQQLWITDGPPNEAEYQEAHLG